MSCIFFVVFFSIVHAPPHKRIYKVHLNRYIQYIQALETTILEEQSLAFADSLVRRRVHDRFRFSFQPPIKDIPLPNLLK
jgi:hypothetical protein